MEETDGTLGLIMLLWNIKGSLLEQKDISLNFNPDTFFKDVLCSGCAQNVIHMFDAIEISLAKIRNPKFGNQIK